MQVIQSVIDALLMYATPTGLLALFGSTTLGVIIGALPGLTATLGLVMLVGLTYSLSGVMGLTVLMGVYIGAIYGGSITAITINVPGTGSAAATCLDGYPLALKGQGASAIRITRAASIFGTFVGAIALMFITPVLASLALMFTSAEYTTLTLFGILICGSVTAKDLPIKGWIAGFMGVLISLVGIDGLLAQPRFTFGITGLMSGINPIPSMIGFFAIPQIIKQLRNGGERDYKPVLENSTQQVRTIPMLLKNKLLIAKSTLIGLGIGLLPGVGENIAAWLAYGNAKSSSKTPERFGTGCYEGVIAPETANNAAIGGALIPMLCLALPGSPPAAVMLSALQLQGIRPGPMLTSTNPTFTYEMAILLILGSVILWVVGVLIAKPVTKIIDVPNGLLMPIVAVLCVIGTYSLNISRFDLIMMFVFGIIGYILDCMQYPSASIVLGMLLGVTLDVNLRRALMVSDGSLLPFVTRPIAILFLLAILYSLLGPIISKKMSSKFKDVATNTDD